MKIDKILVFLFFLFSVLHQVIGTGDSLIFLRMAQFIGLISFQRVVFSPFGRSVIFNKRYVPLAFKILLICVISTIVVEVINARLYLLDLIYPISFFSISLLILKTKPSPTFYIIVSFIVFSFLLSSYLQGLPPSEWVKGSRNFVSIVSIYVTLTTVCISFINNRKPTIITYFVLPFLTLTFSVFALGRSGILTSLLLFIICIFYFLSNRKRNIFIICVLCALIILVGYFVYVNFDFIGSSFLYKFERRGLDLDERADVIDSYISNLNLNSFIFSFPNLDFIYSIQGLTLHNSYLHWHYSFGLGAFFLYYIVLKFIYLMYKKTKFLSFLFLVVVFRSFSDQVLLSDGILIGLPFMLIFVIYDFYMLENLNQFKSNNDRGL